jgi:hypothetical protein
MDDFGKISSIESLPLPEGPHVRDFDEAERAARKAARAAKKAVATDVLASPAGPGSTLGPRLLARVLPPERDTVTPLSPAPDAPYVFAVLDDPTFHSTLSSFVQQAQAQYADFSLTLYYRILPGLQDAQRRFKDHEKDSAYRLDGCKGIEEYIRKLGLNPASVRKWRQRDKERQSMREIKLLAGGPEACPECGQGKKHAPSCSHYVAPLPLPPESETEAKILAEQCLRMTNALLGPSVDPLPERVKKVISMAESVQEASAGGRYDAADFALPIPSSEPESVPVSEPDPDSLEELRQRIGRMADTDDIKVAVQTYLDGLLKPLCDGGLILSLTVNAQRSGRERIDIGDWVELISRDGTAQQIGRVVDRDKLLRPVIRWFEAAEWQKPRSLYANSGDHPHVLSAAEAQDKYSDEFACYRPSKAEIETSLAIFPVQSALLSVQMQSAAQSEEQPVSRVITDKYTPRKTANGYGVFVPGEKDCIVDGLPTMDAAWEQIEKLKAAGSMLGSETSHARR